MKTVKITFPTYGFAASGGFRVLAELANGLAERGHDVTILTQADDSVVERFFKERTSSGVCRAHILKRGLMPKRFLGGVRLLASSIPKSDAVVATYSLTAYPTLIASAQAKGRPFYLVQHYEPIFFSSPLLRNLVKLTYMFPARIAVVSRWLQERLRRFGRRSVVINPGINHRIFRPHETKPEGIAKILYFHRPADRWRGFQDLLEALRLVRLDGCKLLVVSETGKSLGDVKPPIPVEEVRAPTDYDLAKLYSSCQVFVSASWYEGFGLPPLEAMACGAPVVTTDSGGIRDYAVHERNALVVPPRNSTLLSQAIERLVHDAELAERLRRNGLVTAMSFTWEKTVSLFENFLLSNS